MDAETVLDVSALEAIRSLQQPGAEDLVSKIVGLFVEDSERYGAEIGDAIHASDAGRLGAAAHSLKSCAANVGAMQVSALAARLEALGRSGDVATASELHRTLDQSLSEARQRLSELIAGQQA
jgi:HPt (histidine-containing phosphotransfer) domain-containing protein